MASPPSDLSGIDSDVNCLFKRFRDAEDMLDILHAFSNLWPWLRADEESSSAQAHWPAQLAHVERTLGELHDPDQPLAGLHVAIVGAGPVGLRTAIEILLRGGHVTVIEKRDTFSRNNILHLWNWTEGDLKRLGVKIFYAKFGTGGYRHIGTRQLQGALLRIALLLGADVRPRFPFSKPFWDAGRQTWSMRQAAPAGRAPNAFDRPQGAHQVWFDILIGADGACSHVASLAGYGQTKVRFNRSIALVGNLENRNTKHDHRPRELSLVRYANRDLFVGVEDASGLRLENLVYFRGETHYFVATVKLESLISLGIVRDDTLPHVVGCDADAADARRRSQQQQQQQQQQVDARGSADDDSGDDSDTGGTLLGPSNVDHSKLMKAFRQLTSFVGVPSDAPFVKQANGKPDVALFDFSERMSASEPAKTVTLGDHRLLTLLVGDALSLPFWPSGTGINKGFCTALDAVYLLTQTPFSELCSAQGPTLKHNLERAQQVFEAVKQVSTPEGINIIPNSGRSRHGSVSVYKPPSHPPTPLDPSCRYRKLAGY